MNFPFKFLNKENKLFKFIKLHLQENYFYLAMFYGFVWIYYFLKIFFAIKISRSPFPWLDDHEIVQMIWHYMAVPVTFYLMTFLGFFIHLFRMNRILHNYGYSEMQPEIIFRLAKRCDLAVIKKFPRWEDIGTIPGYDQNDIEGLIQIYKLYRSYR